MASRFKHEIRIIFISPRLTIANLRDEKKAAKEPLYFYSRQVYGRVSLSALSFDGELLFMKAP